MTIRRSDRETLQELMTEYGPLVVFDELIDIFDEDATTHAKEEALGVLDRALRKAIKLVGSTQPQGRGRQAMFRNAVEEEDLEDIDDLDDEDEEEDEDE